MSVSQTETRGRGEAAVNPNSAPELEAAPFGPDPDPSLPQTRPQIPPNVAFGGGLRNEQ